MKANKNKGPTKVCTRRHSLALSGRQPKDMTSQILHVPNKTESLRQQLLMRKLSNFAFNLTPPPSAAFTSLSKSSSFY